MVAYVEKISRKADDHLKVESRDDGDVASKRTYPADPKFRIWCTSLRPVDLWAVKIDILLIIRKP